MTRHLPGSTPRRASPTGRCTKLEKDKRTRRVKTIQEEDKRGQEGDKKEKSHGRTEEGEAGSKISEAKTKTAIKRRSSERGAWRLGTIPRLANEGAEGSKNCFFPWGVGWRLGRRGEGARAQDRRRSRRPSGLAWTALGAGRKRKGK
ncbi:uncharacterized protein BJX67DRAFT_219802 [Aspergillus lucknowensis]|uniref:Uncharacterized protein n=1 Tax=Aspergillus lucknowensis TaxID=176173 RepID=A0ABR4LJY4_9EURO